MRIDEPKYRWEALFRVRNDIVQARHLLPDADEAWELGDDDAFATAIVAVASEVRKALRGCLLAVRLYQGDDSRLTYAADKLALCALDLTIVLGMCMTDNRKHVATRLSTVDGTLDSAERDVEAAAGVKRNQRGK